MDRATKSKEMTNLYNKLLDECDTLSKRFYLIGLITEFTGYMKYGGKKGLAEFIKRYEEEEDKPYFHDEIAMLLKLAKEYVEII